MPLSMPPLDERTLARREEIVAAMRGIVPADSVIADEARLRPYESDGLTAYRQIPLVVVLPETTAQVSQILAWCHAHAVRVVPRGSGTSLSGGALPLGDAVLLGASPELLLKSDGRRISTCPIAGTRRRGRTRAEDAALAEEMLHDAKERAEHLMLVDLGRNDLGRVAKYGSVKVKDAFRVERYSHVMHIVSTVEAELAEGKTPLHALASTLPMGTLSGAPKIRAMEIIEEVEFKQRSGAMPMIPPDLRNTE